MRNVSIPWTQKSRLLKQTTVIAHFYDRSLTRQRCVCIKASSDRTVRSFFRLHHRMEQNKLQDYGISHDAIVHSLAQIGASSISNEPLDQCETIWLNILDSEYHFRPLLSSLFRELFYVSISANVILSAFAVYISIQRIPRVLWS